MGLPEANNRLKLQITALRSNNRTAILDTLEELRSEGDTSILPELFNLLLLSEDEEILGKITSLLNDLKDREAAEIMAGAIANPEYESIQNLLLSACWQNGLSYGKYISTFIDVVVYGSYSAAVEAFTVIEEAVGELDREERSRVVRKMKSKLKEVEDQKKPLFVELLKTIESY